MTDVPAPRRNRRWRRLLIIFAVLVVLYAAYRYTLHRMVEAKLDAIRKEGFPVTYAELEKSIPQVPASENAAVIYLQAFDSFVCDIDKQTRQQLPIVGEAKLPPESEPLPDQMKKTIASYLEGNSEALQLLHKAATMKQCRFDVIRSERGLLPLSGIRQAARLLALESLLDIENQQSAEAVESIVTAMAMAQSLADEPFVIPLLVRSACERFAQESLKRSLHHQFFTSDQIKKLESQLAKAEDTQAAARALVGEWAGTEELFAASIGDRVAVLTTGTPNAGNVRLLELFLYEFAGLKELDHRRSVELIGEYVEAAKLPLPERIHTAQSIRKRSEQFPRFMQWSRQYISILDAVITRDASRVARLRLSRVALAVEEHRLATGQWLQTISDLPSNDILADPFDGQPLRYKKLAKGYIVYSIGEDGVDDGGDEKKDITFTVER